MQQIMLQLMNALSYGALLFMIASGFSLIFGLMKMVNMVHVAYFATGGYVGYWVYEVTGSFVLAVLATGVMVALIGAVIFKFLLYKLHGNPKAQVLLCLGLLFVIDDALLAIYGGYPKMLATPSFLSGMVTIANFRFPVYRLSIIVAGVMILLIMELLVNHTKVGALVRSGVDDEETTRAMAVNVDLLFISVYMLGAFLAGVGGVFGAAFMGLESRMCFNYLPLAMAIVIVGGLGNLKGAFYGSLIVSAFSTFGQVLFPEYIYFTTYLPVVFILVFKPDGLFKHTLKAKKPEVAKIVGA